GAVSRLTLHVPDAAVNVRVKKGAQQQPDFDRGTARIALAATGESVLELTYEFALPQAGGPITVPLVQPGKDCNGETRVRVWSEAGAPPAPPADRLGPDPPGGAGPGSLPGRVAPPP